MKTNELMERMSHHPIHANRDDVNRIKLLFLFNLLAGQTFTDEQLQNARDALVFPYSRSLINVILGLKDKQDTKPVAGPNDPTAMPLALMEDDNKNIQRRLLAFLRPDPKMLIEVEKKEAGTEQRLYVYEIRVEDGRGGLWTEAWATEELLRAFLRGIRVAYAMSDLQRLLPDFGDDAPLNFTEQSCVNSLP